MFRFPALASCLVAGLISLTGEMALAQSTDPAAGPEAEPEAEEAGS